MRAAIKSLFFSIFIVVVKLNYFYLLGQNKKKNLDLWTNLIKNLNFLKVY